MYEIIMELSPLRTSLSAPRFGHTFVITPQEISLESSKICLKKLWNMQKNTSTDPVNWKKKKHLNDYGIHVRELNTPIQKVTVYSLKLGNWAGCLVNGTLDKTGK